MKTLICTALAFSALVLVSSAAFAQPRSNTRSNAQVLSLLREQRLKVQAQLFRDQSKAVASQPQHNRDQVQVEKAQLATLDNMIRLYNYHVMYKQHH